MKVGLERTGIFDFTEALSFILLESIQRAHFA